MRSCATMNVGAQGGVHARLEHVVAPDDEAQQGDRRGREHHRLVAEERLAAEAPRAHPNHAHHRQDHDVDRRVRENQNRCWCSRGMPPPGVQPPGLVTSWRERVQLCGRKKLVIWLWSSRFISIAAASTGVASSTRMEVTKIAQVVMGMRNRCMPGCPQREDRHDVVDHAHQRGETQQNRQEPARLPVRGNGLNGPGGACRHSIARS